MPFGELPYRVGLETKKKIDKHFSKPSSKRYKSIDSGHITSGFISDYEAVFPSLKSQVIYDAENTRRHHFRIFGIEADFGYPINWHLDPKTQNSWPITFCTTSPVLPLRFHSQAIQHTKMKFSVN